jgi:hypothetical protein
MSKARTDVAASSKTGAAHADKLSTSDEVALSAHFARRDAKRRAPRLKVSIIDGASHIEPDHPVLSVGSALVAEAIGTADFDFLVGFLTQLANASSTGGTVDEKSLNFMFAVVEDIEPRDQIEAMLAAQIAAVHMATMTFARRLNHVDNLPQQDSAERAFNKLARTFAAQVEALKRYRTGGAQKVTVEHVHVHEGGQAIVGSVEHPGGGSRPKSEDQPHAKQIAHAPIAPMPSTIEADREAVPVAIGKR